MNSLKLLYKRFHVIIRTGKIHQRLVLVKYHLKKDVYFEEKIIKSFRLQLVN